MSDSKNNLPIIIGVVALLAVAGGAMFYFFKNMTKNETPIASSSTPAPISNEPSTAEQGPSVSAEETDEATQAAASAGTYNGVAVKPGNPVVAEVDDQKITRVDVYRYIKMMPQNLQALPPQAIYPLALDQVINTRIVQNKAEAANLQNDPEVKEQMSLAEQQIIRSIYVQREVDKQISDADLKSAYDDYVSKIGDVEEIKAAHILVDSEDKAKDIIKKLDDGGDFAALAKENSGDPGNKDKGGDLGWFAKADMVPEFADAAFKLGKGDISKEPVKTQFGWHIVKVEDKRERPKPTFEELKPMLQVELRRQKLEAMLEGWKKTAKIEKFDINGEQPQAVAPAAGEAEPQPAPAPEAAPAPAQ